MNDSDNQARICLSFPFLYFGRFIYSFQVRRSQEPDHRFGIYIIRRNDHGQDKQVVEQIIELNLLFIVNIQKYRKALSTRNFLPVHKIQAPACTIAVDQTSHPIVRITDGKYLLYRFVIYQVNVFGIIRYQNDTVSGNYPL